MIVMQAIATEAVVAPPDRDGPHMFRCAARVTSVPCTRARGAARHRRVGGRRRTRDAIARAVFGRCSVSTSRSPLRRSSRSTNRRGRVFRDDRTSGRSGNRTPAEADLTHGSAAIHVATPMNVCPSGQVVDGARLDPAGLASTRSGDGR
jgi:hypothetical protein